MNLDCTTLMLLPGAMLRGYCMNIEMQLKAPNRKVGAESHESLATKEDSFRKPGDSAERGWKRFKA